VLCVRDIFYIDTIEYVRYIGDMLYKLYSLDDEFIGEADGIPINFTGIIDVYSGAREWWFNGKWHREDGPAVIHGDGTRQWCINGLHHRIDGPACEYLDGSKSWYVNGKRHRIDGPACEWKGEEEEWYIDDKRVTEEQCMLLRDIMRLKGMI